jgi:hypothetical protein
MLPWRSEFVGSTKQCLKNICHVGGALDNGIRIEEIIKAVHFRRTWQSPNLLHNGFIRRLHLRKKIKQFQIPQMTSFGCHNAHRLELQNIEACRNLEITTVS